MDLLRNGGGGATGIGWILRLLTFKFQEIQTYMLICFIRHFFLEGIRGQVSYHSENFNLTFRYIFCCSVIAFVIGQIWRGGGGKSLLEGLRIVLVF